MRCRDGAVVQEGARLGMECVSYVVLSKSSVFSDMPLVLLIQDSTAPVSRCARWKNGIRALTRALHGRSLLLRYSGRRDDLRAPCREGPKAR